MGLLAILLPKIKNMLDLEINKVVLARNQAFPRGEG